MERRRQGSQTEKGEGNGDEGELTRVGNERENEDEKTGHTKTTEEKRS